VRMTRYPKEQMHRRKYTKLTREQIDRALVPAAAGPSSASECSPVLVGRSLKIVTDNGPVLSCTFQDERRLTIAEGDAAPVSSGYGALTLEQVVLFSHMVPKTQRGYNVVIDLESHLATVFEVWFSGYKDNREVQRQMYYGYVEVSGQEPPKERHHLTNRLEGKGFHWTQDTGIETLEFYPSVVSSSFVELTRLGGELTFCGPSDFIMINDHQFIYDRVECEFSGVMTLHVLDLFALAQIGVRLGFDETDTLEYHMFRGTGRILGHLATFEPFRDHGEKIVFGPNMPPTTAKGQRPVYRPLGDHPPMTEEEVRRTVQASTKIFAPGSLMAGNAMPPSPLLVGKQLTVRYDDGGPIWDYRFPDLGKLHWRREGDTRWHEEAYVAFEPDAQLLFLSHMHSGASPNENVQIALDLANGLTTCVDAKLGSEYMANEVSYKIRFGTIGMEDLTPPRYVRHAFTDELLGHAFTWNYADTLTSMHVYSTPYSFSWTIFLDNGALGMQWSSPAQYVKLRDGIYLFTWVEEACNGAQGTIVINTRTMHDCGFTFSGGKDGLNLGTIGAYARHAGCYDVREFFGRKRC
jgi:hypothetical protein